MRGALQPECKAIHNELKLTPRPLGKSLRAPRPQFPHLEAREIHHMATPERRRWSLFTRQAAPSMARCRAGPGQSAFTGNRADIPAAPEAVGDASCVLAAGCGRPQTAMRTLSFNP